MARRALAPLGVPVILLKGTAFHAADLDACGGRSVGDLDILVPHDSLGAVEAALLDAGWERMKEADGYDDAYYRRWMHELPPLIHRTRDRMIDVHHTILPLTARPTPDAGALIAGQRRARQRPAHPLAGRHHRPRRRAPVRRRRSRRRPPQPLGHRSAAARIRRRRSRFLGASSPSARAAAPAGRARRPRAPPSQPPLRYAAAAKRSPTGPLRRPAVRGAALARNGWGQEQRKCAPLRFLRPLALAQDAAADAGPAPLDQGDRPLRRLILLKAKQKCRRRGGWCCRTNPPRRGSAIRASTSPCVGSASRRSPSCPPHPSSSGLRLRPRPGSPSWC